MSTLQHYDYNGIDITFYDFDEDTHSQKCKANAVHIVTPTELNLPAIKQEIADDINRRET